MKLKVGREVRRVAWWRLSRKSNNESKIRGAENSQHSHTQIAIFSLQSFVCMVSLLKLKRSLTAASDKEIKGLNKYIFSLVFLFSNTNYERI